MKLFRNRLPIENTIIGTNAKVSITTSLTNNPVMSIEQIIQRFSLDEDRLMVKCQNIFSIDNMYEEIIIKLYIKDLQVNLPLKDIHRFCNTVFIFEKNADISTYECCGYIGNCWTLSDTIDIYVKAREYVSTISNPFVNFDAYELIDLLCKNESPEVKEFLSAWDRTIGKNLTLTKIR